MISFIVSGNHMSGLSRSHELPELGGRLVGTCRMAECYRLHVLETEPEKPALVRVEPIPSGSHGAIDAEEWLLPEAALLQLALSLQPPQAIGRLWLDDGRLVYGFVVEPAGMLGAQDITHLGSWRAFLASREAERLTPAQIPQP